MRLLFFGSGEFGLATLQSLHQRHDVAAVISQPDRPAGRKRRLTPTPVAAWAADQGMPVLKSPNVNAPDFVEQVRAMNVDASVVIAFGQKLSPELIDAMGKLAVNLHASLLPSYRGAAPINWAMIHGHQTTGVSVIALAQRMDAGDIYATASLDIDPLETAGELHDRLAQLGPEAVGRVLHDLETDQLKPVAQDEAKATLAPKLSKADGTVEFDQSADLVRARIHGLTPWPGCRVNCTSTAGGEPRTLIIGRVQSHPDETPDVPPGTVLDHLRVATAAGTIELLELQAPGTKMMPAQSFARGHGLAPGDVLRGPGETTDQHG